MATTRTFTYNIGANIAGTDQVGNLAIGRPTVGYQSTGLKWWNGPNEDLGYVIAEESPTGEYTGADGQTAYLGFWRSSALTEASFIEIANLVSGQSFASGDAAKVWLNSNGYWTSWGLSTGEGTTVNTGDYFIITEYREPATNGEIVFPAHPAFTGQTGGFATLDPNTVGAESFEQGGFDFRTMMYIYSIDGAGVDQSANLDNLVGKSGLLTLTQGANSVTYSFTAESFFFSNAYYFYDSLLTGALSTHGSLVITSPASGDFNSVDPIQITITT